MEEAPMEKIDHRRRSRVRRIAGVTLIAASVTFGAPARQGRGATDSRDTVARRDDAGASQAFLAAYAVFMHPRCMNCHPEGDVPLQGEDSRPHAQNVKRGPDGRGKYALKCGNCHQHANLPGANMPPGTPNWHLPPPEMRMVFQGKTPGELARQLQDPAQNGGKTLEQLIHHVSKDPLVLWGWDPGDGRARPPLSHAEFVQRMREWVERGAASPD
jgi:hypothetical protein